MSKLNAIEVATLILLGNLGNEGIASADDISAAAPEALGVTSARADRALEGLVKKGYVNNVETRTRTHSSKSSGGRLRQIVEEYPVFSITGTGAELYNLMADVINSGEPLTVATPATGVEAPAPKSKGKKAKAEPAQA